MGMSIGSLNIAKLFLGSLSVESIWLGPNKIYESTPQLDAPVISLDNDNLVIEDVEGAEAYDIYDGNTLIATIPVGGYNYDVLDGVLTIGNAVYSVDEGVVTIE